MLKIKLLLLIITFDPPVLLVAQPCAWDSCETVQLCLSSQHAFFYPEGNRTLIFPLVTPPSFSASFICGDGPPLHLQRQHQ